MALPENPAVVVLLVVTDGGAWLPAVLAGLRAQDYRPLEVVAVDNASQDGSGALLVKTLGRGRVTRLQTRAGYGRALDVALQAASERAIRGDAYLILHDDAELGEGAVSLMVGALGGRGVGIVGAKLLEWDNPDVLQDIGRTTDRYGRSVSAVERDEIDQGQHAGTREVLYATSAALLVARDVIERVGLFDPRYVALRDDLDLCWRARLVGYRTVVAADAGVRHVAALSRDLRDTPVRRNVRYYGDRNLIATLIKNYSRWAIAFVAPVTLVLSLGNAILYLARGRRRSAAQVLDAIRWNMVHLPSTLRARARIQRIRTVGDRHVTRLMHHGASRVRTIVEQAAERVMGEVEEGEEDDVYVEPPGLLARIRRHPAGLAITLTIVVAILGARPLFVTGQVAGLDFAPFPSASGFFETFASGWRGGGLGAGPATPGMVLLGILTALCWGSGWLAQRVLLFGLPVLGAVAMYRMARALGLEPAGRRLAVLIYATSPLLMGTFGAGRLPDLVLVCAAPLLVMPLLRAGGLIDRGTWRSAAAGSLGLAVAASLAPWALVFVAGVAGIVALVRARAADAARAVLTRGGIMIATAVALLFPWSGELFKPGSPLGGGGADRHASLLDLLALSPAAVRPIPLVLAFGATVVAVAGVVRGRPDVPARAVLAGIGLGGLVMAWAVAIGVPAIAARPALPLIGFAVVVPVFCGDALDRTLVALGSRNFGATHVGAIVLGLLVAAQVGATALWVGVGSRPGLVEARDLLPASLAQEARTTGDFRIVWLSGSAGSPRAALTGPSGSSMTDYLPRTGGEGTDLLKLAVATITTRSSTSAGRILAALGVRYVVVRPDGDGSLTSALDRQADLAFLQRLRGTVVYRNEAGMGVAAPVSSPGWIEASRGDVGLLPIAEASPAAGPGFRRQAAAVLQGDTGDAVTILLAEAYSDRWRALAGDQEVEPERSFGWGSRFELATGTSAVTLQWRGQWIHRAAIALEAVLLAAFLFWRAQRVSRDRGEA
ncbi:MAG TPA: glycosyltransferase family 2 protein [Actinomycetota bacterium]